MVISKMDLLTMTTSFGAVLAGALALVGAIADSTDWIKLAAAMLAAMTGVNLVGAFVQSRRSRPKRNSQQTPSAAGHSKIGSPC